MPMQSKITRASDSMEDIPVFQDGFRLRGWDSGAEPDVSVYVE